MDAEFHVRIHCIDVLSRIDVGSRKQSMPRHPCPKSCDDETKIKDYIAMTIRLLSFAAILLALSPVTGSAQGAPEPVRLKIDVSQPSLFANQRKDVFKGTIDDKSGTTVLEVTCSAGASAWLGLSRIDEACAIAGNGTIKNPNNPAQSLPRIS